MNWLFPIYLSAAAAIVLPLALHFSRRWPRRPVVFPAMRLLIPAARKGEARAQRLRRWLVLALRCLALALLAGIFARPFFNSTDERESRAVAVVIDNSLSLQARERWPSLQRWARDTLGEFGAGDRAAVMTASPEPSWLVAPTIETDRVLAALDEVNPGWQSARLDPALRLAATWLAGVPADRRDIVVLTDHQRVTWLGADFGRALPPGIRLIFPEPTASAQRQAALMAPELTVAGDRVRASVMVRNQGSSHARTLRIFREGEAAPLQEVTLTLAAGDAQAVTLALPHSAEEAGRFRFTLDPDDLPADDASYAVWQPRTSGLVLLDENSTAAGATRARATDFVAAALKATSELPPKLAVRPLPQGEWPVDAIAVLRGDAAFAAPRRGQLETFLSKGGAAVVFASAGADLREWLAGHDVPLEALEARAEPWRVRDWQLDHPLVEALGRHRLGVLLDWEFRHGWALPNDAFEPLARWSTSQAAISEVRIGAGRLLLCGFAPERSAGDWPSTPAFVQFVHQACVYLFNAQRATTHVGEVGVPLALPEAGRWEARSGPAAGKPAQDVTDALVPATPGLYTFSSSEGRTWYAINLRTEESDLAAWEAGTPWTKLENPAVAKPAAETEPNPAGPHTRGQAEDAEQRQPLWWWAAVAAFFLLIVELALANRTTR